MAKASAFDIEEVTSNYFNDGKITIYSNTRNFRDIVQSLGYAIDEEGYVVDRETNERIKTIDDTPIKLKEIGVILPHNSPHKFIKDNLGSLALYLASQE